MATADPRTLESYREIWNVHLLSVPVSVAGSLRPLGDIWIDQITSDIVTQVRNAIVQSVLARGRFAKTGGRVTANRALQQAQAAWEYGGRNGWVTPGLNPWSTRVVNRYDEEPDDYVLTPDDYQAIGAVLLNAEERLLGTKPPLPYRTIAALYLLLLTGARMQEVLQATLHRAAAGTCQYL